MADVTTTVNDFLVSAAAAGGPSLNLVHVLVIMALFAVLLLRGMLDRRRLVRDARARQFLTAVAVPLVIAWVVIITERVAEFLRR